jgi:hypothetical protein
MRLKRLSDPALYLFPEPELLDERFLDRASHRITILAQDIQCPKPASLFEIFQASLTSIPMREAMTFIGDFQHEPMPVLGEPLLLLEFPMMLLPVFFAYDQFVPSV